MTIEYRAPKAQRWQDVTPFAVGLTRYAGGATIQFRDVLDRVNVWGTSCPVWRIDGTEYTQQRVNVSGRITTVVCVDAD